MDRKSALQRLKKLAQEQHEILEKLAQMAEPMAAAPNSVQKSKDMSATLTQKLHAAVAAQMPEAMKHVLEMELSVDAEGTQRPQLNLKGGMVDDATWNKIKTVALTKARELAGPNVQLQANRSI